MRSRGVRQPWWRRAVRLPLRFLSLLVKILFVILLIVIPIPIAFRPNIPKPERRNRVTQVDTRR